MLLAFLIGVMIGRVFDPPRLRIEDAEPWAQGLQLWFNREPPQQAEQSPTAHREAETAKAHRG